MKKNISKILFYLGIFIFIFIFKANIISFIKKNQLNTIHHIIFYLKNYNCLFLFFLFLYGLIHSFSPGHGKMLLYSKNFNQKKKTLFLCAFYIAYMQGITSFLIVKILILNNHTLTLLKIKDLDLLSIKIYAVILIFTQLFSYVTNKCILKKYNFISIILTGILPCSGILTVLFMITYLKYQNLLFLATIFISTGILFSLSLLIFISDNFNKKIKIYNNGIMLNIISTMIVIFSIFLLL